MPEKILRRESSLGGKQMGGGAFLFFCLRDYHREKVTEGAREFLQRGIEEKGNKLLEAKKIFV